MKRPYSPIDEDEESIKLPSSLSIPKKKRRFSPSQQGEGVNNGYNQSPSSSHTPSNVEHIHDLLRQRYLLPNKLINTSTLASNIRTTNQNIQFQIAQNLLKKVFPLIVDEPLSADDILSTETFSVPTLQSLRESLNKTLNRLDSFDTVYVSSI